MKCPKPAAMSFRKAWGGLGVATPLSFEFLSSLASAAPVPVRLFTENDSLLSAEFASMEGSMRPIFGGDGE